jgi:hypothetical protein
MSREIHASKKISPDVCRDTHSRIHPRRDLRYQQLRKRVLADRRHRVPHRAGVGRARRARRSPGSPGRLWSRLLHRLNERRDALLTVHPAALLLVCPAGSLPLVRDAAPDLLAQVRAEQSELMEAARHARIALEGQRPLEVDTTVALLEILWDSPDHEIALDAATALVALRRELVGALRTRPPRCATSPSPSTTSPTSKNNATSWQWTLIRRNCAAQPRIETASRNTVGLPRRVVVEDPRRPRLTSARHQRVGQLPEPGSRRRPTASAESVTLSAARRDRYRRSRSSLPATAASYR